MEVCQKHSSENVFNELKSITQETVLYIFDTFNDKLV